MAINFPTATTVGQTYTDPTSGNAYVVIAVGPPAQWVSVGSVMGGGGGGTPVNLDQIYFRKDATNGPLTDTLVVDGNILPNSDNSRNLGSPGNRFANVYTGDLHLKNEKGDWTVIEESEFLTLRNNNTNTVYKLLMEEVGS